MSKINLLPPQLKQNVDYAKKNASLLSFIFIFFTLFGILAALGGFTLFLVSITLRNTQREVAVQHKAVEQASILRLGDSDVDVQKESEKIQRKIKAIKTIEAEQLFWSKVLEEISFLTPDSAYLDGLPLSQSSKERISINGFAVDQLTVAIFRDAIDNSLFFKSVDIQSISTSTSSKLRESGYNFIITAQLVNTCLFSGAQNDPALKASCDNTTEKNQ